MKFTTLLLKKSKILALSCGLATVGIANFATAQSAVTDPVGYVSHTINAGVPEAPTKHFLSLSLAAQSVEFVSTVSSGSTGSIIPAAEMELDAYAALNGPFYIITEDGDMYDIVSNMTDSLELDTSDDLSGLVGKQFKIYKHQTLKSVFGAAPEDVLGAATAVDADIIRIFNNTTKAFISYFYKNEDVGRNTTRGWVNAVTLELAEDTIIRPNAGFTYDRKSTDELKILALGGVINSPITTKITSGNNFVCIPYPVDRDVTLNTSGLYDADNHDLNKHLKGAASASDADIIRVWDGLLFTSYYYKTGVVGRNNTIGWADRVTLSESGSTKLPQGVALPIKRQSSLPTLHWKFANVLSENE